MLHPVGTQLRDTSVGIVAISISFALVRTRYSVPVICRFVLPQLIRFPRVVRNST